MIVSRAKVALEPLDLEGNHQMNKETASKITTRMETCLTLLTEIVQIAHADCSDSESKVVRRGIGYVLSEMQDRIADPIYRMYPELVPKEVDYSPLEGPTISELASAVESSGGAK
jgi:hypothetical protein